MIVDVHKKNLNDAEQALDVRGEAARLDGEGEVGRRDGLPAGDGRGPRGAVEGAVDLDAVELGDVVLEPGARWRCRRIEAAAPIGVLPSGSPDPDGHGAGWPCIPSD